MEHKHSKLKWLGAVLLFIVTIPFVLAGLIIFGAIYLLTTVLPSPIERLIYKKSEFYRDLGIKYTMSITSSFAYKTYPYVKKNPDLELIVQSEGYFYYRSGKVVLVLPYYAEYIHAGGKWYLTMKHGGDVIEPKDVKITFQNIIKADISDMELKLLVKEKYFQKADLLKAREESSFVFYNSKEDFATLKV